MSSVIIDNWGISDSLYERFPDDEQIKNHYKHYGSDYYVRTIYSDLCWQNFLTSIILWDDIYLNISSLPQSSSLDIQRTRSLFNILSKYIDKENNFFHLLDRNKFKFGHEQIDKIIGLNDVYNKSSHINLNYHARPNLLYRGFGYVLSANALGYNYLPHPERAKVLKVSGVFTNKLDPTEYFDALDQDIQNYIAKVNSLYNRQLKTVPFPALYNFINKNTKDSEEELALAIKLRENKNVKAFRKSIDLIQTDFENGNQLELDACMKSVNDICNEITSRIYSEPCNVEVSLGLSPSLNFIFARKSKPISKLHTTFLYDLADFAIEGRINKIYKL